MAKQGLWANINRRKRLGISRPKSQSTISAKAYANMKAGFPKKKAKGGMAMDESMAHEGRESKSMEARETRLEKKGYKENKFGKMVSAGATLDKRKRVVKKANMMAKGGIARGCGAIMSDRRKVTKRF
ncbi:hypothetical protein EB169_09580 [archaeon]|nr:hypothetical protein [archaeon]